MDSLTQSQELYCQARHRGLTQRAAYREAYPRSTNWKDSSVDCNAAKLEADTKVSQRLAELNKASAKAAKITKTKLLNRLDKLAGEAEDRLLYDDEESDEKKLHGGNANILIKATKELLPYAEDEQTDEAPPFVADFALHLAPAFLEPHRRIAQRNYTDYFADFWAGGGRGSMKSSWASLEVVNHIEQHPEEHGLVLMKYQKYIRDAAYAQVVWAITMLGLEDDYEFPETTLRIRKKSTGQLIIFRGCDDPAKTTKAIKIPFGRIGIIWFEEADMFRGMAEIRKVRQSATRGATNGDSRVTRLYTFNPPRSKSCWINEHIQELKDKGQPVYESTYLEAPREWLGDQFFADAEELKTDDTQSYQHEYLGLPVGLGGDVFDRVVFREITDAEIATFDNLRCGQDFGWYPDPWAYTMSEWQPGKRRILTYFEDGGNKLQPNEQAERIIKALVWRDDPNTDPVYHHLPVMSDDAEPQDIAAQRDTGVNARAAGKGNMRMASYRFLQSCVWVIDPVRCPRLAKEVREMQYDQNKDGEWLNVIPDGNDHWVDAARYAFMREARSRYAYRATQGEE